MKIKIVQSIVITLCLFVPSFSLSDISVSEEDKPFVSHLQGYFTIGWSRADIPGASPEARKTFVVHWKKYYMRSKIGVIHIAKEGKDRRRIAYYYKQPAAGTTPEAFEATIVRTSNGGNTYIIEKVVKYKYGLDKHLRDQFHGYYRSFKSLFEEVGPNGIDLRSEGRLIPSEYLKVINHYLSRDEYFALYKINYEKNIIGYIVKTPRCYGTPKTGISLYVFREQGNGSTIEYREDAYFYESEVEIAISSCGDAGETWEKQGYIVDINKDGYLDVIAMSIQGYYDMEKNVEHPPKMEYKKFVYGKDGKFFFIDIAKKEYENIKNNM